jgi:hypothetical protein
MVVTHTRLAMVSAYISVVGGYRLALSAHAQFFRGPGLRRVRALQSLLTACILSRNTTTSGSITGWQNRQSSRTIKYAMR